ncbi:MAG: hypothetical protein ACTHK6_02645 [Solirubrobacterales bacterium]
MTPSRLPVALALGALALTLASCGGSGSSSSTDAAPTSPTGTAQEASPSPASKQGGAKAASPAGKGAPEAAQHGPHPPPREVRRAGRAAGFLVPRGDNSIPTYGSEGSASERRAAEAALAAYLDARAGRDWSSACRYLAASTRGHLEELSGTGPKGCPSALQALLGSGSSASLANPLTRGLASLRIEGENAFALWIGPQRQKYAMPMAREGDGWRVTQVAPLPYPPGSAP